MDHDYLRVPETLEEAQILEKEIHAIRDDLYWCFTRIANAPPVPAKVTRRHHQLKRWIQDFKKGRPLRD